MTRSKGSSPVPRRPARKAAPCRVEAKPPPMQTQSTVTYSFKRTGRNHCTCGVCAVLVWNTNLYRRIHALYHANERRTGPGSGSSARSNPAHRDADLDVILIWNEQAGQWYAA